MKEPLSQFISPEPQSLFVENIKYLDNGPYSLQLNPGEIVGLSGQSGIGKSQLLRALVDLSTWTGAIRYGQHDIAAVPATRWRKLVGLVPAESAWWYDTVAEHFEPDVQSDQDRNELLQKLGFTADVFQWSVSRLSSGERQRLAIFRTLINGPRILLLDEPTSNLDHEAVANVENLIVSFKKQGGAVLVISHDPEQLDRLARRLYTMKKDSLKEVRLAENEA